MGDHSVSLILKNPDLWLGGDKATSSKAFVKGKKIGAILNCTPEVPYYFPGEVEYTRISLGDSRDDEDMKAMRSLIDYAADWIHVHRDIYNMAVYVHCNQGISRSATCVAAYLIKYKNMSFADVKDLYLGTRQAAFYHGAYITFEEILKDFETKYHKI